MARKSKSRTVAVKEVQDGDTFITERGEKIRIAGVDTPEKRQPGAGKATKYLKKLIEGKKIKIVPKARDKYKRTVALVYDSKGKSIRKKIMRQRFGRKK